MAKGLLLWVLYQVFVEIIFLEKKTFGYLGFKSA